MLKTGNKVVIDGKQSSLIDVVSSVSQSTVLGPLLFLLHINDLPSVVSSKVSNFADDCLIYRNIKNKQDQITLQKDQNLLEYHMGYAFQCYQVQCYLSVMDTHPKLINY